MPLFKLVTASPSLYFSAQQDSIKKANMKRENKAYSFKEQIIEMELKEVSPWRCHALGLVHELPC